MSNTRDQATRIMSDIRYQIFAPEVSTWGLCPTCDKPSRGGAPCADCRAKDLDDLLHSNDGTLYVAHCRAQQSALMHALRVADELDGAP